ncbi:SCO family protein [Natrarchaeobaculum sulfurireducens]|nr:SCO family protein [Natrarchaeobaculum sulfurireducens]AXR77374.1 Cytochrome oxidase Cu insertion factor, SCO1/SenC/PrrC family [Natrarchaeobaculum sulfurireducens]
MNRRTYLQAASAAGLVGVAGCLDGVLQSGADGTVLGPPEQDLSESSHPTYGDELPSFSVPDAFTEEPVTDEQFRGEQAMLMTFVFTSCPDGLCPALLQMLNAAAQDAQAEGYEDDAAFVAITFDPDYDTPEVLEQEAENVGFDPSTDNWHVLRPEDNDVAYDLVAGDFGVPVHLEDHEDHGDEDGDHNHEDGDDHDSEDGADHDHDGEEHEHGDDDHDDDEHDHEDHGDGSEPTDGTHFYVIFLVNEDGIVERSYPGATDQPTDQIIEDLRTVVGE